MLKVVLVTIFTLTVAMLSLAQPVLMFFLVPLAVPAIQAGLERSKNKDIYVYKVLTYGFVVTSLAAVLVVAGMRLIYGDIAITTLLSTKTDTARLLVAVIGAGIRYLLVGSVILDAHHRIASRGAKVKNSAS